MVTDLSGIVKARDIDHAGYEGEENQINICFRIITSNIFVLFNV